MPVKDRVTEIINTEQEQQVYKISFDMKLIANKDPQLADLILRIHDEARELA